jgi:hypothetical protein
MSILTKFKLKLVWRGLSETTRVWFRRSHPILAKGSLGGVFYFFQVHPENLKNYRVFIFSNFHIFSISNISHSHKLTVPSILGSTWAPCTHFPPLVAKQWSTYVTLAADRLCHLRRARRSKSN